MTIATSIDSKPTQGLPVAFSIFGLVGLVIAAGTIAGQKQALAVLIGVAVLADDDDDDEDGSPAT